MALIGFNVAMTSWRTRQALAGERERSRLLVSELKAEGDLGRTAYPPPSVRKANWTQIATIITALTAVGALVFNGLSLSTTRSQISTIQDQNLISEQGQITDRFNAAVTNLGSGSVDVRLGGLFALQRLMQDSQRDQPAVVQVVAAYVRNHAPQAVHPFKVIGKRQIIPAPDVQAALKILGMRDVSQDQGVVVDLFDVDIRGADLSQLNFADANMSLADLSEANLMNADFSHANLSEVGLSFSRLAGANFTDANMANVNFTAAEVQGANFNNTLLNSADFLGTTWCDGNRRTQAVVRGGEYVCNTYTGPAGEYYPDPNQSGELRQ